MVFLDQIFPQKALKIAHPSFSTKGDWDGLYYKSHHPNL